jgi:hypothetical protein
VLVVARMKDVKTTANRPPDASVLVLQMRRRSPLLLWDAPFSTRPVFAPVWLTAFRGLKPDRTSMRIPFL